MTVLFHAGLGEIRFLSDVMYNQFKLLVFGNIIERVFRSFAFIQAIFFLKIKRGFNKNRYFTCHILMSNY